MSFASRRFAGLFGSLIRMLEIVSEFSVPAKFFKVVAFPNVAHFSSLIMHMKEKLLLKVRL